MPVIQFDDSDKLAGKVAEKGAYTMELTEIRAEASKSAKSVNYWTTFRITKGPLLNKEFGCSFNTSTKNQSLLGTMQFFPAHDLMKVAAAIQNVKFDDVSLNIDTDTLLNKPLDVNVDIAIVEGAMVNILVSFAPTGILTKGAPF